MPGMGMPEWAGIMVGRDGYSGGGWGGCSKEGVGMHHWIGIPNELSCCDCVYVSPMLEQIQCCPHKYVHTCRILSIMRIAHNSRQSQ